MGIIKTFLVPGSVEMTDRLMDPLWVLRALTIPCAVVNLNLSQNAATHWTSSAWMYSVDYVITVFFCENNLIAGVSFPCLLSDGAWGIQQLVEKRAIARCPLRACPLFARLSWSPSAVLVAAWLCAAQALVEGGHFSSGRWVVYALTSRGDAELLQSALVPCEEKHNIRGWGHFWGCSTNSRCLQI